MGIIGFFSSISTSLRPCPNYEDIIPSFPVADSIEHNLFQIALCPNTIRGNSGGGAMLSEELLSNQSYLKEKNPGWRYACYDNDLAECFVRDVYGKEMLSYYCRVNESYGAARADFLRYLLLYYYGGVYLDIKCKCTVPLDSVIPAGSVFVLPDDELWAHSEFPDMNGKFYFNAFIAAPAGHCLLRRVIIEMLRRIDLYNPFIDGVGWHGVVTTTGTYMYSSVINTYLKEASNAEYIIVNARRDYGYENIYQSSDWKVKAYHSSTRMSDYRLLSTPVVYHKGFCKNAFNLLLLKIVRLYRRFKHLV